MGFFNKIKQGLKKTRESISGSIGSMLNSFTKIDEELFEELEELLIMGDVGMLTAEKICETLRARVKEEGVTDPQLIMGMIQDIVADMISGDEELHIQTKPSIILVIGVNGVGKTTTIGKMALRLQKEGKKSFWVLPIHSVPLLLSSWKFGQTARKWKWQNVMKVPTLLLLYLTPLQKQNQLEQM